MNDAAAVASAKKAVGELLDLAGIAEVICVDDVYGVMPVEDVIQECVNENMKEDVFGRLPHIGKFANMRGDDTWRDAVRAEWLRLNSDEQQDVVHAVRANRDVDYTKDFVSAGRLDEIFRGRSFRKLSLAGWRVCKPTLRGPTAKKRTLVLFDQDMKYDGGSDRQGTDEISVITSNREFDSVTCGLLTHKATTENASNEWERLSSESGLPRDRWLLTPKTALSDDPRHFAFMMRLTVMSPACAAMKERVKSVLEESLKLASEKLNEVKVHDFDHVVMRLPQIEGAWEPDMLVRLFGIYQRAEMLAKMRTDAVLHDAVERARSVSAVKTKSPAIPQPSSQLIQRAELYEGPDIINGLHLPIELGDIFELIGSSPARKFILLANPCNLMVRSKGRRAVGVEEALLAEIVEESAKAGDGNAENALARYAELPYFDTGSTAPHWVDLRRVHSVRLKVLDLCVFNGDGDAKISTSSSCPGIVIPPWQRRHGRLRSWAEELLSRCTVAGNTISVQDLKTAQQLQSSNSALFSPVIDTTTQTLQYNCKRVDHLCRSRAFAILAACAAYHTRPAFEQDIGKELTGSN